MRYIPGPELLWLLMYGAAHFIAGANVPPSKGMEEFIEYLCYWIAVPVGLTFGVWLLPQVPKRWLLARVWLACIVGGHLVLETALAAHSRQGPGIGTVYIVGMIVVIFFLIAGTLAVLLLPALRKIF